MDRRHFLQFAGAAAALSPMARALADGQDPWMAEFARSDAPWTLAYRSPQDDLSGHAAVRGRFPAAVHGVLFRNGPAIHDLGGQRYQHWFDGDGMVQRYAIGAGSVTHTGKVVRTEKYTAESAAGRRLVEGFGSKWEGMRPVTRPDAFNVANTSVLPLAGELLALWEGGSPYALDPETLRTLGPKAFSPDLRGVPFSAHPHVDADGTLWNFGVSALSDKLVIYEIGADGRLRRSQVLDTPHTSYMHDFAVTDKHLVFLMPPVVLDRARMRSGLSFLDSHLWRPEVGMKVLVVDKSDFSRRTWLELPAGFTFHIGNAWEDAQGVIRVDYVHADTPDAMFATDRELMRGRLAARPAYHIATARLDPAKGTATQELLAIQAEFPQIDRRLTGRRHRHLLHATQTSATHPGFSAIARTDVESGKTVSYSYGEDHIVEEHLFVPEPGSAPGGAGWVIGSALDLTKKRTVLACFNAKKLADGPVAVAALPYALPAGLHAAFVKA